MKNAELSFVPCDFRGETENAGRFVNLLRLVGRASFWSAATESAELALWVGVAVASAGFETASDAKAVTSQTPSPHSKRCAHSLGLRRMDGSWAGSGRGGPLI